MVALAERTEMKMKHDEKKKKKNILKDKLLF